MADLNSVAKAIVAPYKGILAADESTSTIKARFDKIAVENVEANRQAYRQLLFTTSSIAKHVSGVILFDETIKQSHTDGTPFPKLLLAQGIHPGIKLDAGAKPQQFCPGEFITEGLDGLPARVAEYVKLGATFAKWRAVIVIKDTTLPSATSVVANAHALARYAAICQEGGLVPIVEPEILMDGDHTIERSEEVHEYVLRETFAALTSQRVKLEGIILKPSMVISGTTCATQASPQEVAERTLKVLKRTVPSAVPGIAFLSGGQSDEVATLHLDLMNKIGGNPWPLTFSYGRALQHAAQQAWRGQADNVPAAQAAFAKRAHLNGLASRGEYNSDLEKSA
eukprot:m.29886 g.29886  ORF g.29886 m.29886 type:complete len:339 (-) comp40754_c0_seq1:130-1146(-)